MRTAALSLRDRFADPEPLALHREGDVVIAIVASAWGSWSGLDGEALTVDAAMSTLVREARGPTPLDPEALRRAFVAASERLDQHPVVDNDALDFPPVASLITVVATPSAILVGWMGSVVACIVDQASVVRSTPSHTLRRQLLEEQDVSPDLVDATLPAARHIMVRTVQPLREARPEPELAQWPP
ncbi:MAG: hypothetical protein KDK70_30455, partial [Myxococcales bacterium]|nr:hypothetical protein [Myxococcales bacterium]